MMDCPDVRISSCSRQTYGTTVQPSVCSEVHATLETFAGITSLHGVPRIINSRSLANRLFWAAVFVFAVFMFFYTGRNLLEQYFSYPKKVNVEIVQNPVPFPSVTLCNTDHLDFIVVEKLEKVFNTVEEDNHGKEEINITSKKTRTLKQKEDNDAAKRSKSVKNEEEFRKNYLKFQSTLSVMMQSAALGNTGPTPSMKDVLEIMSRLGLVANLGPQLASKAGIRAEDFIVFCRFMEDECDIAKTFVKIFDPYFFNCFTFEPHRILRSKSTRLAGIEYGLTILLFPGSAGQLSKGSGETETMIPGLIQADPALASNLGAKVVIHAQNSIPHFTTDGYDIPSGFSVSIGIRARQNVRVSLPHGNCSEEEEYKHTSRSNSSFKYTLISCQNECIQMKIAAACKCIDNRMPYKGEELSNIHKNLNLRHKKLSNVTQDQNLPFCLELPTISEECRQPEAMEESICKKEIQTLAREFNNRTRCRREVHDWMTIKNPESIEACKCYPPCKDVVYDTSYSISRLPDNRKQNSAFYSIVDRYLESMSSERRQALKRRYGNNYSDEVKSRISRLNVHIADNNIIKTTESPDYDLVRLVSDIGGQMGLWIGISVITLVEVTQLVADICAIFLRRAKTMWDNYMRNSSLKSEKNQEVKNHLNVFSANERTGDKHLTSEANIAKIYLNRLSTV